MKGFRQDSLKSHRPKKMALMLLPVCGACLILTPAQVLSTRMVAVCINPKVKGLLVRNVDVLKTFGRCVHIQKSSHNVDFTSSWRKARTQMI